MDADAALKVILVDSDVIIEALRGRNTAVGARWNDLASGGALVLYSPVTAAEIWHGARESERESISRLFSVMSCVPIDAEIGRRAGDYLRLYRPSHQLDLGDALIAATAVLHNVALWTRNRKHYPMRELRFY